MGRPLICGGHALLSPPCGMILWNLGRVDTEVSTDCGELATVIMQPSEHDAEKFFTVTEIAHA